jgi:hypothetical protein
MRPGGIRGFAAWGLRNLLPSYVIVRTSKLTNRRSSQPLNLCFALLNQLDFFGVEFFRHVW